MSCHYGLTFAILYYERVSQCGIMICYENLALWLIFCLKTNFKSISIEIFVRLVVGIDLFEQTNVNKTKIHKGHCVFARNYVCIKQFAKSFETLSKMILFRRCKINFSKA